MKNIWLVSDTHFSHANFLNFVDSNGNKIRPFSNVDQMDEYMITKWNENVQPGDRVYHLGDFGFNQARNQIILPKLNGSKRLILGNHDTIRGDLITHFSKIVLWRRFKEHDFICSHIPLREDSMGDITFNIHGHIHQQLIMNADGTPNLRYINLCVEHWDYTPVHLDTILVELAKRKMILQTQSV